MKKIAKIFARNLRLYRKNKHLSQQALAERVGVSVITIQNYEALRRWPSPESIHDLANALGVPESEFFSDHERESQSLTAEQLVWAVSDALGVPHENTLDPISRKSASKHRRKSK